MRQCKLATLGQRIFVFSILCFGLHEIAFASGLTKVAPGPPWGPSSTFITFEVGVVFTIGGLALAIDRKRSFAAASLAALLLLRATIVYVPGLITHIHRPDNWTAAFELFGMCSAAAAIAAARPGEPLDSVVDHRIETVARILFALSVLVFAIQHFLYARFVAGLIPAWCPFRLFFAWFVGVAFAATTISIVVRRIDRLALQLLGAMFMLWVMVLHLPRSLAAVHNGDEWTSTFVALAFCGASWAFLATCRAPAAERNLQ